MAKKKTKTTPHNTGLSITRSGNKFTAKWKIAAKNVTGQKLRYRIYRDGKWRSWNYVTLSKSATSCSFTLAADTAKTKVEVQTSTSRAADSKYTYKASAYESSKAFFSIEKPSTPTLTVSSDSANNTTFTWAIDKSDTAHKWYTKAMYRTRLSDGKWSKWAQATKNTYTYTDTKRSVIRSFEIRAWGPAGYSATRLGTHYLYNPPVPTWGKKPVTYSTVNTYYAMTYNVNISGSPKTVDKITPEYCIGTPDAKMQPQDGASWEAGADYAFASGKKTYALSIATSKLVGEDECLWGRVTTEHDGIKASSKPYRIITGKLAKPSANVSITQTPTHTGFSFSVEYTANTDVPGAYAQVYVERYSKMGLANYIFIGTIPNGTQSKSFMSSVNLSNEKGYAIHIRNVSADGKSMTSAYYTYKTTMPSAPTLKAVSTTGTAGQVYVEWTNSWKDATGSVVAWTDDPTAWQSNNEPETYEINEVASAWYISGLETGKRWYFRVRSFQLVGDNSLYTSWSDEMTIDLASAPTIPVLYLSDEAITDTGMTTAYWSYMTSDGTAQVAGEIVTATYKSNAWTYGKAVGSVTDAQHLDIYAEEQGWKNGQTINLALRTRSGSGGLSEYSTPVTLTIAEKPTVRITSTTMVNSARYTEYFVGDGKQKTFTLAHEVSSVTTSAGLASVSGDQLTFGTAPTGDFSVTYTANDTPILSRLPLTVNVAAGGDSLSLAIERAEAYPMIRPDGTATDGAMGETAYISTITPDTDGQNTFTVELDDLIGRLDDGAYYNIVATAKDSYGQTADTTLRFRVIWGHQAWEPTADFVVDNYELICYITPKAGADYADGDTCDIYRLGADTPELIYTGAEFGKTYVDPYPAFGVLSGYKIVTVTKYGDYITPENAIADFDTNDDRAAYGQLNPQELVVDFGSNQIRLPYNITVDNTWAKDFERTRYLGGSIVGDHNRGVMRDVNVGTVLVRGLDEERAQTMRELAMYTGLCHVRTPEGSSFTADVQVSESRAFDTMQIEYTLNIQKVDSVEPDGMTLDEWEAMAE